MKHSPDDVDDKPDDFEWLEWAPSSDAPSPLPLQESEAQPRRNCSEPGGLRRSSRVRRPPRRYSP